MTEHQQQPESDYGWPERIRLWGALALACVLFWVFAWRIVGPWDPKAAITLLSQPAAAWAFVRLLALAGVTAALGSVIYGGRLPDFGAFCVSAALVLVAARCSGMDRLLLDERTAVDAPSSAAVLFIPLILELLVWSAIMAASLIIGRTVEFWVLLGGNNTAGADGDTVNGTAEGADSDQSSQLKTKFWPGQTVNGLLVTGITAGVAIVVLLAAYTAPPESMVHGLEHRQVLFVVGLAFFLGSLAAYYTIDHPLGWWACMAVPLVGVIGYMWAISSPEPPALYRALVNMPPNALSRGLPLDYMSAGVAGALLGYWTALRSRYGKQAGTLAESAASASGR